MSKHVNNSGVHDATRGATVSARYGPIALHASILRLNGRLADVDSLNCLPHIQPLEMVEYGSRTYVVLRICLPGLGTSLPRTGQCGHHGIIF